MSKKHFPCISILAVIARGNTALLNKILSYETSVGHGQPDMANCVAGLKSDQKQRAGGRCLTSGLIFT